MRTTSTRSPRAAPPVPGVLAGERRIYYLYAGSRAAGRPFARFTDGADADTAVAALERMGGSFTLLSRDEDPALPRPGFWRVERASVRNWRCTPPGAALPSRSVSR